MNRSAVNIQQSVHAERAAIIDFLFSIGDELHLQTRSDAEKITDLLFEHGGAFTGYHGDTIVGVVGYFLGEPSCNYANKEVGFIYVTAIAKAHRLSRMMWNGLGIMLRHLHTLGVKEIRCHAREQDRYTNRLYSHFAKPLGKDVSLRGDPTILYGNTIEDVLAYLDKGQSRRGKRLEPATQPSSAMTVSIDQLAVA